LPFLAYGPIGRDVLNCAETHAPGLIGKIFAEGGPKYRDQRELQLVRRRRSKGLVSVQGRRDAQTAMIDERADGRGNPYYWISFTRGNSTPEHGTDLAALVRNNISVTPLKLDLTDEPALTRFARALR
jgi:5'-nucleotidase